jgi:EAL domain-containing protein (putative c-di-GMP-specific phosphodiesterase class I)
MSPGLTGRVLVVDDEPELLAICSELLRDAGHATVSASSAESALDHLRARGFDVVVSDIRMPGLGGIDLLRAVRRLDPDLPVVLVTGSPTLETAIQALEHGALQYLTKPVPADALEAAVARALRLRRMALLKREALEYLRPHQASSEHDTLDDSLSRALDAAWMAYQPIVRSNGSVFAYEALFRTDHAAMSSPLLVFEAAERLKRVLEVGRTVRGRTASSLSGLDAQTSVFVNLHALELTDEALVSPDAPLAPAASRVVFEITERASLDAIPDARAHIQKLREMGFRVALDDLGAGYAGLSSLALLEPDVVKLDVSLVRGAHAEPVKRKLIGSITSVCHDLGILVVAEGIEVAAERDAVIDLGVDLLQGFLFARPARHPVPVAAWGKP